MSCSLGRVSAHIAGAPQSSASFFKLNVVILAPDSGTRHIVVARRKPREAKAAGGEGRVDSCESVSPDPVVGRVAWRAAARSTSPSRGRATEGAGRPYMVDR